MRPQGHPYNRDCGILRAEIGRGAEQLFFRRNVPVVDEGPGLSGSSFLAVAEALERAGAPGEKIVLVSSHEPNVDTLAQRMQRARWRQFSCVAVSGKRAGQRMPWILSAEAIGAAVLRKESEWPAIWTSFERLKYFSSSIEHR